MNFTEIDKLLVSLDNKQIFSQEYFAFLILIIFAILLNTIKDIVLKYLRKITKKQINE
jgi:hypothetical protein